jgi:NCS1 family nucleobase:cation symporter-1
MIGTDRRLRNPWLLYKSSATFGNYLGAYGVLLSCIAGPMITDYWLVRRGHYRVNDLYTLDKEGWYYYTRAESLPDVFSGCGAG